MEVIKTKSELKDFCKNFKNIGFIPTMGALHEGHESLIKKAVSENATNIVSIFVNPTQFLPNEDLTKYPRTFENDLKLCEKNKVSAVFAPNENEIYEENESFKITPPKSLISNFEGLIRPGHFEGVCLVILKLLNLIKPQKTYFGKKDAQQLLVIKNLVKQLFLDVEIIPCETVRDNNNLALSSRNTYLSQESKQKALEISKALFSLKNAFENGEKRKQKLLDLAKNNLQNIELDYFEIVDFNLAPVQIASFDTIAIIAGKIKNDDKSPRLLDNVWL